MPTRKYDRREPTHDWQQLRPLLKDPTQLQYEVIRPVILFGQTPKERAIETGVPRSTIYYRSNLFDQAGMASLFPAAPPPPVPEQNKLDQRTLAPPVRQAIVNAHAEYPALSLREIASICYARFGRRPSPRTIKMVLATGPKPQITDPAPSLWSSESFGYTIPEGETGVCKRHKRPTQPNLSERQCA